MLFMLTEYIKDFYSNIYVNLTMILIKNILMKLYYDKIKKKRKENIKLYNVLKIKKKELKKESILFNF